MYRKNARAREWEDMMNADFHGGWTSCVRMRAERSSA